MPFDLLPEHPTCCHGPLLWSLGDVRQSEFVGHSDDSKHLAARLVPAHQNKHRRFLLQASHNTPCSALNDTQRKNATGAQDPTFSHQNTVRVKGQAWRSQQKRFSPATMFHRMWLHLWWRESSGCFCLLDSCLRSFSSPSVSFFSLLSHKQPAKDLNMHTNGSEVHTMSKKTSKTRFHKPF